MRRLSAATLLVFLTVVAIAQTAVVSGNVNVRADPSTDNPPITKLMPGTQVQLLEPDPTNGYYHIRSDGQTGWVFGRHIQLQQGSNDTQSSSSSTASPSTTGSSSPSSGQDLFSALMTARKPAVGQPLVENGTTVCGPTGDANDAKRQDLNSNKNRTDLPGTTDYVQIGWDDLSNLPSDRITDFQGAPVTVVGFLSHKINVENQGSGESTNCHLLGDTEVDWHMYLTKSPAQQISDAIIVETTPRTRPAHKWRTGMLAPVVDASTRVRISGWLIFDFEHTGVIGTERATVWEVHPITKIEIENNGQWVDLDSQ